MRGAPSQSATLVFTHDDDAAADAAAAAGRVDNASQFPRGDALRPICQASSVIFSRRSVVADTGKCLLHKHAVSLGLCADRGRSAATWNRVRAGLSTSQSRVCRGRVCFFHTCTHAARARTHARSMHHARDFPGCPHTRAAAVVAVRWCDRVPVVCCARVELSNIPARVPISNQRRLLTRTRTSALSARAKITNARSRDAASICRGEQNKPAPESKVAKNNF